MPWSDQPDRDLRHASLSRLRVLPGRTGFAGSDVDYNFEKVTIPWCSTTLWGEPSHRSDLMVQCLASRLAARVVVSSTLPCAPVAQWGVTAWSANNCDSYHLVVWGRLFTHRGGAQANSAFRPSEPRLERQRQVWFITFVDVKSLDNACHTWALLQWGSFTKGLYSMCMIFTFLPLGTIGTVFNCDVYTKIMAYKITILWNVWKCKIIINK